MRTSIIPLFAMLAALMPTWAFAQTSWVGPNGGQMVDAGGFHVELTVSANSLAGTGSMKRTAGTKVLVLLRVPDQATAIARFDIP